MIDVLIIGAGPAGMSAAIYVQRAGKQAVLLEKMTFGGKIVNTPEVANYPGLEMISGFDFAMNLYNQATKLGAKVEYEQAMKIEDVDGIKKVHTASGKVYEAKTVIIATGAANRHLGLAKEDSLVGKGVSYCATCDGAFFKGQDVAVNGGGATAIEDAMFLANYCKKVYVIHRRGEFRAPEVEIAELKTKGNVEFVLNSTVTKLLGDGKLEGVEIYDSKSEERKTLAITGLFVAIGQEPANSDFANVADLDDKGYVLAAEDCKTKTPGVFTAGDCRTKTIRQLTTAASDGTIAALAATLYISQQGK